MKYFELSIASYQGKTAHLSLAEHGAYVLMMMTFYSTEKPLPADRRVLYRLLRAESPAERKAIDAVASEFWSESNGKLTNPRCDETLARYVDWVAKQKANGSRGGRPKETHGLANGNPTESQREAIANPSQSHGKANGSHDLESYSENDLKLPTHTSDSESDAGASAPRARGGGSRKRREEPESDWVPPTEEQIRAGN
jgi:uncharacterized protein YdaU (DUF1376 family)